jgi:hypothetical protein
LIFRARSKHRKIFSAKNIFRKNDFLENIFQRKPFYVEVNGAEASSVTCQSLVDVPVDMRFGVNLSQLHKLVASEIYRNFEDGFLVGLDCT